VSEIDIAPERTDSRARLSLQRIIRKKPRKRFRGTPPPLRFDLAELPENTLLNETETAAACRRAKSTLEVWRKQKDHPLRWRRALRAIIHPRLPQRRITAARAHARPRKGAETLLR
jgi:hypothetical protein